MAFIQTQPEQTVTDQVLELFAADRERLGYVANYTKIFSQRPEVYAAWQTLIRSIKTNMDLRRYELVTLAAVNALRSSYCCLAHGQVMLQFFKEEQVARISRDFRNADLSPAEVAMMAFTEKVTRHAHEVTQVDINGLHAHGFSDAEVFDIVLTAAARNFFSRVLDATGAVPDAAYGGLSPVLLEALVVGREIEVPG
jgi:uncharacterized peroxidase-related enzyme